jgi:uncharacterized membrane protein
MHAWKDGMDGRKEKKKEKTVRKDLQNNLIFSLNMLIF